jgi:hypothetical protein
MENANGDIQSVSASVNGMPNIDRVAFASDLGSKAYRKQEQTYCDVSMVISPICSPFFMRTDVMRTYVNSENAALNGPAVPRLHKPYLTLRFGLLVVALTWLNVAQSRAQPRLLPPHGKNKLDSYNYMLRDVHPASQAQANYLQNRLYLTGLKKQERLERQERLDVYGERQFIKMLKNYDSIVRRLSAGNPTSSNGLATFWVLVSVFGDHAEVYDALSMYVPPLARSEFVVTSPFIRMLQPTGELERPPLLLDGSAGVDFSHVQSDWKNLVTNLRANGRLSSPDVAEFHKNVADFRDKANEAVAASAPASGRWQAQRYLESLGCLADALYRPTQAARIEQYIQHGGYEFSGSTALELVQHMLKNRLMPTQGSRAQLALGEVARPISRVLEQEISVRSERSDSLAVGEGHRPYASEYRRHEEPVTTAPGLQVSDAMPDRGQPL